MIKCLMMKPNMLFFLVHASCGTWIWVKKSLDDRLAEAKTEDESYFFVNLSKVHGIRNRYKRVALSSPTPPPQNSHHSEKK